VLFDKICRKNGITHRLTAPASPDQNGKVERFHGTFRPDFCDQVDPFTSVTEAQAAVDAWVAHYNAERPHQALDSKAPVAPGDLFDPVGAQQRRLVELWFPPALWSLPRAPAPPPGWRERTRRSLLPPRLRPGPVARSSSTVWCPRAGT